MRAGLGQLPPPLVDCPQPVLQASARHRLSRGKVDPAGGCINLRGVGCAGRRAATRLSLRLLHGLGVVLQRGGIIPQQGLHVAQAFIHPGQAAPVERCLAGCLALVIGQGGGQVGRRFPVGVQAARIFAGQQVIGGRLCRHPRQVIVLGDRAGPGTGIALMLRRLAQRLGYPAVEQPAARLAQLAVHQAAQLIVAEVILHRRRRLAGAALTDQAAPQQRLQGGHRLQLAAPGCGQQRVEIERPPNDGGGIQHLPAQLVQGRQPHPQQVLGAAGQGPGGLGRPAWLILDARLSPCACPGRGGF